MERTIAVIDLKSFYASVECASRHLDMFETPLVCCDPNRSESSVVMSVTPYLKKRYGVPNVCRKRDLPDIPGLIFARPRMEYYLKVAADVVRIFREFVSAEDIHVYSVDESFLNIGPYLTLYGVSAEEIAERIKKRIKERLGLTATAGIGDSMFMAKCALDHEGKKAPPYTARWTREDAEKKLWNVSSLEKIWGIAGGTKARLARLGIRTAKELGEADRDFLEEQLGVMGAQLSDLMQGIDESNMRSPYVPREHSLHIGQTLIRDYKKEECRLLFLEMGDDLRRRLRKEGMLVGKVQLGVSFGGMGGGYMKEAAFSYPTGDRCLVEELTLSLYSGIPDGLPIRQLHLAYGSLSPDEGEQGLLSFSLEDMEKRRGLDRSMDRIADRFGESALLRCSSLLGHSTAKTRHGQIGGHRR